MEQLTMQYVLFPTKVVRQCLQKRPISLFTIGNLILDNDPKIRTRYCVVLCIGI